MGVKLELNVKVPSVVGITPLATEFAAVAVRVVFLSSILNHPPLKDDPLAAHVVSDALYAYKYVPGVKVTGEPSDVLTPFSEVQESAASSSLFPEESYTPTNMFCPEETVVIFPTTFPT
jgi:hypothetical protein